MADNEELTALGQGVEAWHEWRKRNYKRPNLAHANLTHASLRTADLSGANLQCADLRSAKLSGADIRNGDLRNAALGGATLSRAILKGADIRYADLGGAILCRANLTGADLSGADLRDANLTEAVFAEANLNGATLSSRWLTNTDFRLATLKYTDLSGANLRHANLSGACLTGANLRNANLGDADLSDATIVNADLTGANLIGTNFHHCIVGSTTFGNCGLTETKGLDLVHHRGPSTIGVDTIYQSGGKIPDSFLLGCGVPANLIRSIRSLLASDQYYSCFISYDSKDEQFARQLHGRMRDAHLRVWFAPEDIQGGKKLHDQIETAIRGYDKLLIVLSKASLQSEWVMDELRKGFQAERDGGTRKLFPVLLTDYKALRRWVCRDSISGRDLAEEIRQYFIPDFSKWKNRKHFEDAFGRLLEALRARASSKTVRGRRKTQRALRPL